MTEPWYKVPFVWLVVGIPLSAVIMGGVILYFSIVSFDGLVVDDYYTEGKKINRVLKPGGRCLCLEFSKPLALLRPFYNLWSFLVIPRLGAWIAREPAAYTYLVESIRRFPDQQEMQARMEQAGFEQVRYRNYSLGIACLHIGSKA